MYTLLLMLFFIIMVVVRTSRYNESVMYRFRGCHHLYINPAVRLESSLLQGTWRRVM